MFSSLFSQILYDSVRLVSQHLIYNIRIFSKIQIDINSFILASALLSTACFLFGFYYDFITWGS